MKPTNQKPQQYWEEQLFNWLDSYNSAEFGEVGYMENELVKLVKKIVVKATTQVVVNYEKAISTQRIKLLNEVIEVVENYFATKGFSSTNPNTAINLKYAQNTIRKELLQAITKLEEEGK
jgi:hypothetical protein